MEFTKLALVVAALVTCGANDMRGPKVWWAKPVAEDFYIGGKISNRQIKLLAESGIKSIMSIMDFTKPDRQLDIPTVAEERQLANKLGMDFGVVMTPDMNTRSPNIFYRFGEVYETMRKPIYYHCAQGFAAMYTSFGYFINQTRMDENFKPSISMRDLYEMGAARGYYWDTDFNDNRTTVAQMLEDIFGKPDFEKPEVEMSMSDFVMSYWWPLAVYRRYYAMGQFQSDHLSMMKKAGFSKVINIRHGVRRWPREEVTLLNVRDFTGPYRQNIDHLRRNRVNASLPSSYIRWGSLYNFELQNSLEFGDEEGYSEPLERAAVESHGLEYHHIPVGSGEKLTAEDWWRVRAKIKDTAYEGNVIIHSQTGWKAVAVAVLLVAEDYVFDAEWAKQRAAGVGYNFDQHQDADTYRDVLNHVLQPADDSALKPAGAANTFTTSCVSWLLALCTALLYLHC